MVKVLGLGDNVCDVYLHTGIMYPGGQALNFAVYAAQMGVQADYMGVFGQDEVAAHVQQTLDEKGVGHSHCRSWPGENGFARVTLVNGDRVFKGSNRGGVLQEHPIALEPSDMEYLASFQLIHTTNNGFTDSLLPILHTLPSMVSYDFSYRWNEEDRLARVCPYVDFAFLSCSDLDEEATRNLCLRLNQMGCGVVTATRGSKGATVYDGAHFYRQLPHLVEPVDTMGAGDSFADPPVECHGAGAAHQMGQRTVPGGNHPRCIGPGSPLLRSDLPDPRGLWLWDASTRISASPNL